MTTPERVQAARQRLQRHGQEHLLRFVPELTPAAAARLLDQIEALDLPWLDRVLAAHDKGVSPDDISPCDDVVRPGHPDEALALARGREALARGQVGVLLVAGGSGSRLGFDGPKGAFPVGPVSGRTLFQVHIEQLLAEGRGGGVIPPLYLMTSEDNDGPTRALLRQHDNFGLPDDRLFIFTQGMAPAVDEAGKLLLADRDRLVLAPNGNGGLFAALDHSGALSHMSELGVEVRPRDIHSALETTRCRRGATRASSASTSCAAASTRARASPSASRWRRWAATRWWTGGCASWSTTSCRSSWPGSREPTASWRSV